MSNEPPTKKKRGRPRKDAVEEVIIPLIDPEEYPLVPFSLTYGKKGDHMPVVWHRCMTEFLRTALMSKRFVNSRERGGKMQHLHGQAVYSACHGFDKASITKIAKAMKEALGTRHGDGSGIYIHLKELGPGQTEIRMAGYCTKDNGQPHHVADVEGFTDEEIALGKAEHESLKLCYMDGHIPLNKSNLFQRCHAFVANHPELFVEPDNISLCEILAFMLNTGKYMFSSTMLMNSNGQMRHTAAETYWAIINGHKASNFDVMSILYLPESGSYNRGRGLHGGLEQPVTINETPLRPPRGERAPMGDYVSFDTAGTYSAPIMPAVPTVSSPPVDHAASSPTANMGSDDEDLPIRRSAFDRIKASLHDFRSRRIAEDSDRSEEDSVAHTSDEEFIADEDDEESGQGDDDDEL